MGWKGAGRPQPPRLSTITPPRRRAAGFLGIGRRRITGAVVVALGEERRESVRPGLPFAIGLGRLNVGRAQRLGQPARAAQQPLGLLGHVGLLQMIDELRRLLALRLPHRFEDARLRNPAEVIVDGRGPAGRRHVEVHRARQRVGVSEAPRAAAPRLMHGVDAQRSAMREQRRLAVAIERHQRVPEIILGLGQLLSPIADGGPRSRWRRRSRRAPAPGR